MSKPAIITLPNPLLRRKSKRIITIDKKVVQLIDDMRLATVEWEKNRPHEVGVALAAIQIGALQQAVIVRQKTADSTPDFEVLLNPKIIRKDGEVTEGYEGCLSVPDLYAKVPRYSKIKISAQTIEGQEVRIKAKGFLARVLQHEIDHLEGKLFIDRIANKQFYRLDSEGKYQPLTNAELKKYSFLR